MARPKAKKSRHPAQPQDEKTRKMIEETAYYRWLNRGGGNGLDVDDWLEAEKEAAQNVFDYDPEE